MRSWQALRSAREPVCMHVARGAGSRAGSAHQPRHHYSSSARQRGDQSRCEREASCNLIISPRFGNHWC